MCPRSRCPRSCRPRSHCPRSHSPRSYCPQSHCPRSHNPRAVGLGLSVPPNFTPPTPPNRLPCSRAGFREKVLILAASKGIPRPPVQEAGSRECRAHLTTQRGFPRLRDQQVGSGIEHREHQPRQGPTSHGDDTELQKQAANST